MAPHNQGMSERWRLFVGLFPPPPLAESLGKHIEQWKSSLPDKDIKWVDHGNLHLTLCFLGNVEIQRIEALESGLSSLDPMENIDLELEGLGCFPDAKRPKVIWAGLKGEMEMVATLQKEIASVCQPFMERQDTKRFSPHLTLARIRDLGRAEVASLRDLLERESTHSYGSWEALNFRLMRSEIGPEGSKYTVLKSFLNHPPS
jgi:2'-5' RNA ligase